MSLLKPCVFSLKRKELLLDLGRAKGCFPGQRQQFVQSGSIRTLSHGMASDEQLADSPRDFSSQISAGIL